MEIAHPEKIGVCSARVVLTEDLQEMEPFCDVLTGGNEYESYQVGEIDAFVKQIVKSVELKKKFKAFLTNLFPGMSSIDNIL